MMIEQKIDAFRYRLVRWLVAMLRTLGAETRANELWMFNSRFECPVCRLIRAMRVQNRVLARRWTSFCATCRKWPHRFCRVAWRCVAALFPVEIFQSQRAFLFAHRMWQPQKIPIYLRKKALRN